MGRRVRGRKRDGRRSSLPPPPPGEAGESAESSEGEAIGSAGLREASLSDSSQLASDEREEMDDRVSVTSIDASSSKEVVAIEVLTLPKSASALLSAALPSSARTPVATPANPSSGVTPAVADVSSASSTASAPEPSDLTPIIDMPTLVESANADITRPDAAPLALEEQDTGDAVAAAAAEPPAPAFADPAPAAAPAAAADPGITRQPSVPDPTELSFFDPATVSAHVARAHEPSDAHDIHSLSEAEILHRRRGMPDVAARRLRLARVVQITIGTAGALIILAVLLHLSAGTGQAGLGNSPEMLVAPPSTSEPVKTTGATVETRPPATAAGVAAAASAPAAPESALDAAPAAALEPAASATAAPAASSAESVALAAVAQKALERGKLSDAIDAGEQATTLDPGDARSWLVLGGAYQERGDMQNARRCYTACVQHATRGPVNECRALGGR
jgi:hypothetical protein